MRSSEAIMDVQNIDLTAILQQRDKCLSNCNISLRLVVAGCGSNLCAASCASRMSPPPPPTQHCQTVSPLSTRHRHLYFESEQLNSPTRPPTERVCSHLVHPFRGGIGSQWVNHFGRYTSVLSLSCIPFPAVTPSEWRAVGLVPNPVSL